MWAWWRLTIQKPHTDCHVSHVTVSWAECSSNQDNYELVKYRRLLQMVIHIVPSVPPCHTHTHTHAHTHTFVLISQPNPYLIVTLKLEPSLNPQTASHSTFTFQKCPYYQGLVSNWFSQRSLLKIHTHTYTHTRTEWNTTHTMVRQEERRLLKQIELDTQTQTLRDYCFHWQMRDGFNFIWSLNRLTLHNRRGGSDGM